MVAIPFGKRRDDEENRLVRWFPWIIVALLIIAIPIGFWLNQRVGEDSDRAELETTRADQATTDLSATAAQAQGLADQIRAECEAGRLGGPICQQAVDVSTDPVPGPRGAPGEQGRPGDPGRPGESIQGPKGDPGPRGEPGEAGADGAAGSPGPAGQPGAEGPPGRDGIDGQDGQDGAPGADGAPGRDGSPATGMTINGADGSVMQCTRSGGSDTTPVYDCTYTTPPPEGGLI